RLEILGWPVGVSLFLLVVGGVLVMAEEFSCCSTPLRKLSRCLAHSQLARKAFVIYLMVVMAIPTTLILVLISPKCSEVCPQNTCSNDSSLWLLSSFLPMKSDTDNQHSDQENDSSIENSIPFLILIMMMNT
ncbi:unnamed protein product, partial [Meganyctiphanes norvegica]